MAKPLVFVLGDSISIHYGPYMAKMIAGGSAMRGRRARSGR